MSYFVVGWGAYELAVLNWSLVSDSEQHEDLSCRDVWPPIDMSGSARLNCYETSVLTSGGAAEGFKS